MAGKEVADFSIRKHVRQPPSIPFLWEERPGVAKKDWRPQVSSLVLAPPPPSTPIESIVSVPFQWEKKPGTPLSRFSLPSTESPLPVSPPNLVTPQLPLLDYKSYVYATNCNGSEELVEDRKETIFDFDLETFSFSADDSCISSPFLLANCLVSSAALSGAVPVQGTSSADDLDDVLESPPTPASETDSSTCSYATGISSLAGSSFLECLFPLYTSNSKFLQRDKCSMENHPTPNELNKNSSIVIRRPLTLGELIMMSRRRSCQRKAVQMREQNQSLTFISRKALGCFMFGTTLNLLKQMQQKYRRTLKLK